MAHKLGMPTMMTYGFGQIAEAIKNQGFGVFLLFYYNQVLYVSATGTSIALAVALVFDAVTDPIAGSLSDKLRSVWGRRHPFILISAFPLAVTFYFLFNPPEDLSEFEYIMWLGVFAVLVRASMTFYHVPHLALGADWQRTMISVRQCMRSIRCLDLPAQRCSCRCPTDYFFQRRKSLILHCLIKQPIRPGPCLLVG